MDSDLILENRIRKIVREKLNSLTEERHISDETTIETLRIVDELISNVKIKHGSQLNGYKYKKITGGFETVLFDVNVKINYIVHYFYDSNVWYARNPKPTFGASYASSSKTINVECIYIDGDFDRRKLDGSLKHEITHMYQGLKKGGKLLATRKSSLYDTVASVFMDNRANEYERMLANIAYLTFNEERAAFLQDIHGFLMATCKDSKNVDYLYSQSDGYKQFYHSYRSWEWLSDKHNQENPRLMEALKSRFNGKTVGWFLRNGDNAIKDFLNKLKSVLAKAKDDIDGRKFF